MLNTDILDTLFETQTRYHDALWSLKVVCDVTRVVPQPQLVGTIQRGGTGPYRGRPRAVVYAMPDDQLVRLRLKDDNTYDYDNATYLPETHPLYIAHRQYPNKHIYIVPMLNLEDDTPPNKEHPAYQEYAERNERIVIPASQDKERGATLSKDDKDWLKETIEARHQRDLKRARDLGLIP